MNKVLTDLMNAGKCTALKLDGSYCGRVCVRTPDVPLCEHHSKIRADNFVGHRRRSVQVGVQRKTVGLDQDVFDTWITKEAPDRVGDVVVAAGGRFDNFTANSVVMWAHQYDQPPIGRSHKLMVHVGEGVSSLFGFTFVNDYDFADVIHRLWMTQFINATSIGFMPQEVEPIKGSENEFWPSLRILVWDLWEFSICSIGMHQDALRRSMKYLMTPAQRRREKRRVNEQARNWRTIASVEPIVQPDSELLSSLSHMQKQLNDLKGVFKNGRINQRCT